MTAKEILAELKSMGHENIKNIFSNHGAPVAQYGVKIGDLQKVRKRIKKNYELSLDLYDTGVSDAQYLAGLIADETRMTKKDLQHWVDNASWYMINEYPVAWVAAESAHGWELALKWIDAKKETVQISGWATLASIVSIQPDEKLDIKKLKELLKRVQHEISAAGNYVRYVMNVFVIAAGGYVKELTPEALRVGKAIGKVHVDMGNTACKVPYSPDYIQKMVTKGVKKKKMARC